MPFRVVFKGIKVAHPSTRTPDFLVYISEIGARLVARVIILDAKTGYVKSGIDLLQAQDYMAMVAEFSKPSGLTAEIRNVIMDALPKSSGSVRLSGLRLVQVDYVMMPGKEQAGSMSAREVAEKKKLEIGNLPESKGIQIQIHYYHHGSLKTF